MRETMFRSCRPAQRFSSYATHTITGKSSSLSAKRSSVLSICISRPTKIPSTMTTSRKLVPHLGWKRLCGRTFSTVSGRPFS